MRQRLGLQIPLFLIAVPTLLFQLRGFSIAGGDSEWIVLLVERPLYFFFRAPLVVAFHKGLWLTLRDWGWSAGDCVSLSSSIAGGFFFWALYRFSSDDRPSPDWRIWVPFVASSIPLIFFGHQETYAWPFALSLWTLYFLRGHLRGDCGPFPLYSTLVLATFAHPMAFMLWPGVFWAIRPRDQERLQPILIALVVTGFFLVVFLLFGKAGGLPQRKWILPFFEIGETLTRYPLFSWSHWKELGWFYLLSMPFGLILLVRFGLREWSGWKGGLNATVCVTGIWSLFWHPGMGLHDWDLFSWPGLFVNLAGGIAWSEHRLKGKNENSPPREDLDGESLNSSQIS